MAYIDDPFLNMRPYVTFEFHIIPEIKGDGLESLNKASLWRTNYLMQTQGVPRSRKRLSTHAADKAKGSAWSDTPRGLRNAKKSLLHSRDSRHEKETDSDISPEDRSGQNVQNQGNSSLASISTEMKQEQRARERYVSVYSLRSKMSNDNALIENESLDGEE